MQQRQPRLGDIVDDYCPRERRITNHAVVAMVGDAVKQTRCTTCEAEHGYKEARVPPQRRKKEEEGILYQQVLAGMPRKPPGLAASASDAPASFQPPEPASEPEPAATRAVKAETAEGVEGGEEGEEAAAVSAVVDESVHRPLIRATLPRLTDEPPQRREPEFTMRSPQHTRPGKFGKNGFRGPRSGAPQGFGGNGNRMAGPKRHGQGHGPGSRPGGGRPGPPGSSPHGNRGPRPGGHGHGRGPGKKSPR